ncbi:MAG: sensor histidine kinase [Balneolaceae bacterium]
MDRLKSILHGSPLIIAAAYLIVGLIWIQFSDQWVLTMFDDPAKLTVAQTWKGWFFVGASSLFVFLLVLSSNRVISGVVEDLEANLQSTLSDKDVFLSEIHHRVRNNLALISALFELQSGYLEDPRLKKVLENSRMRLKCLAMIHESFSDGENSSSIDFGHYLEDLVQFIRNTLSERVPEVKIESDIPTLWVNINQAVPCGLIVNELLSNCYIHAFKPGEKGRIFVQLSESEQGKVRLIIQDNGSGFPDSVDPSLPGSLGFTIVKALVSQIKADLQVESEVGTRFSITFDKQHIKGPSSRMV